MSTTISTTAAPAAIGPYSQAVVHADTCYISGQLGLDPADGSMAEGVAAQAERAMQNLAAICEAAGTSLAKAIRCTIYLTDLGDFATVNEIYAKHLSEPYPARACVQVSALPKGGDVEIDAVVAL